MTNIEQHRFDRLPQEERSAIARKGGLAKAAKEKRRRELREAAKIFLDMPVQEEKIREMLQNGGIPPEDQNYQMAIVVGLTQKAMGGDTKAAAMVFDLAGVELKSGGGEVRIVDDL